ncbi:hypothetical protein ACOSP7_004985 [Xanthoceras sorbifolium]
MRTKPEKQSKLKHYVEKHKKILHKARDFYVKSMEDCASKLAYGGVVGCPTAGLSRLPSSFSVSQSPKNWSQVDLNEREQDLRWPAAGAMKRSYTSVGLGKIGRIDEDKPCYFEGDRVYYARSTSYAAIKRHF